MSDNIEIYLERIAKAIEEFIPKSLESFSFSDANTFLWQTNPENLYPVKNNNFVKINQLIGIENSKETLLYNTNQFANGFPANNALLWGARGMGKSSLVKAVHHENIKNNLKLIEISRDDLSSLSNLLRLLRKSSYRFILFCDDLSFENDDNNYKSLKAVLDGGVEGSPENVLFYATSNRRHLMSREMIENEKSTSINPGEAVEEKISLSDRFGIWLGFHPCNQEDFFKIILSYLKILNIDLSKEEIFSEAVKWQQQRGARSGRVAWQFVLYLAGKYKVSLKNFF